MSYQGDRRVTLYFVLLPILAPDQQDPAHHVLRLNVRHAVRLAECVSYDEARSSLQVRGSCLHACLPVVHDRVPHGGTRGEARSILHVRRPRDPYGEARSSPHVRHVRVLLHNRRVCLLADLLHLVLHDLRGPGVLLVARLTGCLLSHHVPDVSVLSTGFVSSLKVCKFEFLFGLMEVRKKSINKN